MPETPRGVIWDLDGTLVDTAELHFSAWEAVARRQNRPFSREIFSRTFGRRNPEILQFLLGPDLAPALVNELGELKEILFREAVREQGVSFLPGVEPIVLELSREGWKHGIGSSAPKANIALISEMTGLARHLAGVIAMEDTRRGKPDPEVFLKAAGALGTPPAWCVVVEDAVFGVRAAKAAGMGCIAVRQGGHSSAEDLRAAGADLVVESLASVSVRDFARLIK